MHLRKTGEYAQGLFRDCTGLALAPGPATVTAGPYRLPRGAHVMPGMRHGLHFEFGKSLHEKLRDLFQ